MPETLRFILDGRPFEASVEPATPLVSVLQEGCGVRVACARAVCGACTVLIDGLPAASCAVFAFQAEGTRIETVRGLTRDGVPHPLQRAFARHSAFQCGYCTAGFLMLAKALLDTHPRPDRATITEWLSSNFCRCTGYATMIEAVEEAALEMAP